MRIKRGCDLALGAAGLLVTLPLMAVAAAGVAITMGVPVLFRHQRAGLRGRPFMLLKFRTMRQRVGSAPETPVDEARRITAFGRLLRRSSVDELPQLWNVIRGDMSLVGPRPLPTRYLSRYSVEQGRRHDVQPGITGWAQVNGRNAVTWDERLARDVWYVDHLSFGLDLRILARTIGDLVRARNTQARSQEIMEEFQGTWPK